MTTTNYAGIDYGAGQAVNRDKETGIRYAVISQNDVLPDAIGDFEPDYGSPHCPKCGKQADEPSAFGETFAHGRPDDYTSEPHECDDYVCVECKHFFGSESAFGDEPIGHSYDRDGYQLSLDSSGDVWVIKSPYFTYAQLCSPCAPGACHLGNPLAEPVPANKCYCLGHDWFDSGQAGYPVWSVETGELVQPA